MPQPACESLVEAIQKCTQDLSAIDDQLHALASYLSDDVICKQILPQSIGKAQLLAFMKAITTAFPDWSFNGTSYLKRAWRSTVGGCSSSPP